MPITINIPGNEVWDPVNEEFLTIKPVKLVLEHSLLSISKWESRWKKSYLSTLDKTPEEVLDYIRCMTLTQGVDDRCYFSIPEKELLRVKEYIEDPMTATTFRDEHKTPSRKKVTNEEIYFQMIQLGIPFSCEKWHLNRLLTLIRVGSIMSSPPKKMSKSATARSNTALNAARKRQLGSMG